MANVPSAESPSAPVGGDPVGSGPVGGDPVGAGPAARLPRECARDYLNEIVQDLKFRYVPLRGYYRLRAYKYMLFRYPELRLLRYLVDRGRVSLDVGANLGLYTYFLARRSPRVYAFEPNPYPFRVLARVADRNVTVLPVALSDRSGEVDLAVPRGPRGWSSNGAAVERDFPFRSTVVRVACRRIDDLGLAPIGFIKIDVEGHERQVLAGAQETLARDRPRLLVENEFSHVGGAAAEVFTLLQDHGYEGFALIDGLLTPLARFSVEEHQIKPLAPGGDPGRYVRNFIFLPR